MIRDNLLSSEIKELRYVVRTGGRQRYQILLWQLTYSEIFFSKHYGQTLKKKNLKI